MALTTPIAFFIFNRPDTTEQVFETIRKAKPETLLVVADGPRLERPEEEERCAAARAVLERVDWDCKVLTNYSETNLGCRRRVSSGLDWVFEQVEEAIILEDDCLPVPSFFRFCEEMLSRYRDEEQVMMISGNNFQRGQKTTQHSYYFSRYNHIWGWATWRRAWQLFQSDMVEWPDLKKSEWLRKKIFETEPQGQKYWNQIFDRVHKGDIDSWGYIWQYSIWKEGGLCVLPEMNLVTNIGFDERATHTRDKSNPSANLPVEEIYFPLFHPLRIERAADADRRTQRTLFKRKSMLDHAKKAMKDFLQHFARIASRYYL